jgi:hypothetical protein
LCVVVVGVVEDVDVVVVGVELVVGVEEELPPFPPHPATAAVLARTLTSVRMAVSGVFLMGRAPIVAEGLERPHYQAFAAQIAVG